MTIQDLIEKQLHNVAAAVASGQTAQMLLSAAKSNLNQDGVLYDYWCDGCGDCGDPNEPCGDEAMLCCIRRFLARPVEEESHG